MSKYLHSPLLLLTVALVACGHPASEKECEEIFERSAVLKLQQKDVTDPAELERRVAEARADQGDKQLSTCVGRRITDDAMTCIRSAKTPGALDACLD